MRLFGFLGLIFLAFVVTTVVFFYAKGYRINFNQKTIAGTGIIQITSTPKGAAVFVNGEEEPREASDVSLTNLNPGKYTVTLKKNGFIDWKKEVEVKAGWVTTVEALLFPSAPNLKAITFTGIKNPKLSPDNQKLVYAVSAEGKQGLWILDLSDRPLFFSKEPKQIAKDSPIQTFSNSNFDWTPDSKQILVTLPVSGQEQNYLLDAENTNQQFSDMTARLGELRASWARDAEVRNNDRLNTLGEEAKKLTAGAKKVLFSPDEERILIVKADDSVVVYDSKPYLSFDKKPATFSIPKAENYLWYPELSQFGHDSRHLILIMKDSIKLIESDGGNETTLYTGQFDPKSVFAWPNGSKLIILTSLNSSTSKEPNLYSIDLH